ncbi:MAG TPA: hypothetical protein VIP98_25395 [Microlunatus sp.]
MHESTLRRTLVFVVCALGVVALWILNDQIRSHPSADQSIPAQGQPSRPAHGGASPINDPVSRDSSTSRPVSSGSAVDPHRPHTTATGDTMGPAAVVGVHVIQNSHDSVTVGWRPADDVSGIAYYEVTLNSIPVGQTGGRELTADWFNDDTSTHFIQIRAVDGAGNRGARGRPLMLTRPPEATNPPNRSTPTAPQSEQAEPDHTKPDPTVPPETDTRPPAPQPSQPPARPDEGPLPGSSSAGSSDSPTAPTPPATESPDPTTTPDPTSTPDPTVTPSPDSSSSELAPSPSPSDEASDKPTTPSTTAASQSSTAESSGGKPSGNARPGGSSQATRSPTADSTDSPSPTAGG